MDRQVPAVTGDCALERMSRDQQRVQRNCASEDHVLPES